MRRSLFWAWPIAALAPALAQAKVFCVNTTAGCDVVESPPSFQQARDGGGAIGRERRRGDGDVEDFVRYEVLQ